MAGDFDTADILLRLLAATAIGMTLGLERAMRGKPTGMRTLGLVSFGAALATMGAEHSQLLRASLDAESRVIQGIYQGVLVGIGFLGGGVILRDVEGTHVHNLTTAAEVWAVAAMGLTAALAPWLLIGLGFAILVILIVVCRMLEFKFHLKDHS